MQVRRQMVYLMAVEFIYNVEQVYSTHENNDYTKCNRDGA